MAQLSFENVQLFGQQEPRECSNLPQTPPEQQRQSPNAKSSVANSLSPTAERTCTNESAATHQHRVNRVVVELEDLSAKFAQFTRAPPITTRRSVTRTPAPKFPLPSFLTSTRPLLSATRKSTQFKRLLITTNANNSNTSPSKKPAYQLDFISTASNSEHTPANKAQDGYSDTLSESMPSLPSLSPPQWSTQSSVHLPAPYPQLQQQQQQQQPLEQQCAPAEVHRPAIHQTQPEILVDVVVQQSQQQFAQHQHQQCEELPLSTSLFDDQPLSTNQTTNPHPPNQQQEQLLHQHGFSTPSIPNESIPEAQPQGVPSFSSQPSSEVSLNFHDDVLPQVVQPPANHLLHSTQSPDHTSTTESPNVASSSARVEISHLDLPQQQPVTSQVFELPNSQSTSQNSVSSSQHSQSEFTRPHLLPRSSTTPSLQHAGLSRTPSLSPPPHVQSSPPLNFAHSMKRSPFQETPNSSFVIPPDSSYNYSHWSLFQQQQQQSQHQQRLHHKHKHTQDSASLVSSPPDSLQRSLASLSSRTKTESARHHLREQRQNPNNNNERHCHSHQKRKSTSSSSVSCASSHDAHDQTKRQKLNPHKKDHGHFCISLDLTHIPPSTSHQLMSTQHEIRSLRHPLTENVAIPGTVSSRSSVVFLVRTLLQFLMTHKINAINQTTMVRAGILKRGTASPRFDVDYCFSESFLSVVPENAPLTDQAQLFGEFVDRCCMELKLCRCFFRSLLHTDLGELRSWTFSCSCTHMRVDSPTVQTKTSNAQQFTTPPRLTPSALAMLSQSTFPTARPDRPSLSQGSVTSTTISDPIYVSRPAFGSLFEDHHMSDNVTTTTTTTTIATATASCETVANDNYSATAMDAGDDHMSSHEFVSHTLSGSPSQQTQLTQLCSTPAMSLESTQDSSSFTSPLASQCFSTQTQIMSQVSDAVACVFPTPSPPPAPQPSPRPQAHFKSSHRPGHQEYDEFHRIRTALVSRSNDVLEIGWAMKTTAIESNTTGELSRVNNHVSALRFALVQLYNDALDTPQSEK